MSTDTTIEATPETVRLTADAVVFGERDRQLYVLLILRGWDPYEGYWALPGGHVDAGEITAAAAHRELHEETGLSVGVLTQVEAYADPGRDPRGRYVTFAYTTLLNHTPRPTAGDDAARAEWVLVDEALAEGIVLAFDHKQIIADALRVAL